MSYLNPSRMRLTPIASALLLAALSYVGPGQQTAHAQIPTEQTALHNYAVAPGSLEDVLNRFARQAGLTLSFDPAMVANRQSQGLRGEYTVQEALERLLTGSGLSYRIGSAGTVTLVQVQDGDGPVRLGPILVGGEARGGPVEGFRAERSSTATNVDAPLIETPATVNVLTRDFLDVTQPRQFSNQFDLPGVAVNSSLFRGFNIRGFNTSPANPESEGVSVMVGNFVAPARRYHFDQGLYERIDVLKGTSAVLFGPSEAGSVVRYIPKRPEFEWRHRLQGTLAIMPISA